jgi:hypothetical protein
MYRLAGKVIDVYDDLKMDHLKENLSKVGSLKLAPVDQVMKLPNDQFALVLLTKTARSIRKFPIHDADSTAISNLYFEKTATKLPPEGRSVAAFFLKKASERFKLTPPKVLEKHAGGEISSNVVNVMKCTEDVQESKPQHLALRTSYPIDTSMQVKTAMSYFDENAQLLEPKDRHSFAVAVAQRAGELKVEIPAASQLRKYAGTKYGNLVESAYHERAALLVGDGQACKALKHLIEKRASFAPVEFAEALEKFDKTNGLDRHWDIGARGVRDPFRSTFESVKVASTIKIGGKLVDAVKLQKLANSDILSKNFGEDFCREFASAPMEILQSLPRPEQTIIMSLAEGI